MFLMSRCNLTKHWGVSTIDEVLFHMRRPEVKDIMTIQTTTIVEMQRVFTEKGFVQLMPIMLSPITDPLSGDVGSSVVKTGEIEYLGTKLKLTQSMILHKQLALISRLDKIYVFSPNVRLENPKKRETGKHAFEFVQLDFEMANGKMNDIFDLVEDVIISVIKTVSKKHKERLKRLDRKLRIPKKPFKVYTTNELESKHGKNWEIESSLSHKEPFWVVSHKREFYDREDLATPGQYLNYDLIYPEGFGEALSGGEREYEYEPVLRRIKENGLNSADYSVYLELSRQGLLVPSAGGGIGIERLVRFLSGRKHIKEVQLFPRIPGEIPIL
jgi:asparaginyl-tRNA synthetase